MRLAIMTVAVAVLALTAPSARADVETIRAMIDGAKSGVTIVVPPGTYHGNLIVDKPVTLDGEGKAVIDGGGKGTVVVLDTDGATLAGFTLVNSGNSHNDLDSAVQVRGNYNVVRDNRIVDTLFGIDLQQSNNNIVRRNHITARPADLGIRGDGIRLWYSMDNRIIDNVVEDSRDAVVWYSTGNEISRNKVSNSRYGLHFMYSKYNLVADNVFTNNTVGIFLMYSDDVVVRRNRITHGTGTAGMGIGLKETSNTDITDNEVLYTGIGLYLDLSPFNLETTNRVRRNTLAFNSVGIKFLNDWSNNLIEDNRLESNIHQVMVEAGASAKRNHWEGNYWDDYEGFDRDQDGIGDYPYSIRVFADRLWMDVPKSAFFKGAPVLTAIDFLERLAPLTEPILMLRDERPKTTPEFLTRLDADADKDIGGGSGEGGRLDPFGLGR